MSVYYTIFPPPPKHDMNGKFNLCTSVVLLRGAGLVVEERNLLYFTAEQAQHGQWHCCLAHLASPVIFFLHDAGITFTVSRIDVSAPVVAHRLLRGSGSAGERLYRGKK